METSIDERLTDAVLKLLNDTYTLPNGERTQGQAISFVVTELRNAGWKNIRTAWGEFGDQLTSLGFRVVEDARNRRGGKATIVTV